MSKAKKKLDQFIEGSRAQIRLLLMNIGENDKKIEHLRASSDRIRDDIKPIDLQITYAAQARNKQGERDD